MFHHSWILKCKPLWGRAWASWYPSIADLMFCHDTHTVDNSRICPCLLFHEHGNLWQTLCSYFSGQRSYYGYTHAWTKVHNEVMSWISGSYGCHYVWPLPEVNSTTVGDLSVCSLPLHVMVCSCHACVNLSRFTPGFFHTDAVLLQVAFRRPWAGHGTSLCQRRTFWNIYMRSLRA